MNVTSFFHRPRLYMFFNASSRILEPPQMSPIQKLWLQKKQTSV
jgi:hypothetical protein